MAAIGGRRLLRVPRGADQCPGYWGIPAPCPGPLAAIADAAQSEGPHDLGAAGRQVRTHDAGLARPRSSSGDRFRHFSYDAASSFQTTPHLTHRRFFAWVRLRARRCIVGSLMLPPRSNPFPTVLPAMLQREGLTLSNMPIDTDGTFRHLEPLCPAPSPTPASRPSSS